MAFRHIPDLIAKQEAFMRWLCLPPELREYSSREKLAEVFEVERSTLYEWERQAGFQDRLQKIAAKAMLELSPYFLRTLASDLLTPGNDKAHQVYWRYIQPRLETMKAQGLLDDATTEAEGRLTQEQAIALFMEIPEEYQQKVLAALQASGKMEGNTASVTAPYYNVIKSEQSSVANGSLVEGGGTIAPIRRRGRPPARLKRGQRLGLPRPGGTSSEG
jgi:hypothetical protein